jgi:hypothetical protein
VRQHGNPQQGIEAEKAERRRARRLALDTAFEQMETVLHQLEGTVSGDYSTREMRIAGDHLDTAWLWAREAAES